MAYKIILKGLLLAFAASYLSFLIGASLLYFADTASRDSLFSSGILAGLFLCFTYFIFSTISFLDMRIWVRRRFSFSLLFYLGPATFFLFISLLICYVENMQGLLQKDIVFHAVPATVFVIVQVLYFIRFRRALDIKTVRLPFHILPLKIALCFVLVFLFAITVFNYSRIMASDCTIPSAQRFHEKETPLEMKENHSLIAIYTTRERNENIYYHRYLYYYQDRCPFFKNLKYDSHYTFGDNQRITCNVEEIYGKKLAVDFNGKVIDSIPRSYTLINHTYNTKKVYYPDSVFTKNILKPASVAWYRQLQLIEPYCD